MQNPIPMDHPVWTELEMQFRARLSRVEKEQIVACIQGVLAEYPQMDTPDLEHLTLRVVAQVLSRRGKRRRA